MNGWALLVLLAPIAPLLGRKRGWVAGIAVVSLGALLGVMAKAGPSALRTMAACQIVFWAGAAAIRCEALTERLESQRRLEEEERGSIDLLKRRHVELKESVALEERQEKLSFQIYGAAKMLAEAVSWTDMAPRLASAIQRIFNAYDSLLYARGADGRWTLLQRRGSWTQEPPVDNDAALDAAIVSPPQVAELMPVLVVPIFSNSPEGRSQAGVLYVRPGGQPDADVLNAGRQFGDQLGGALAKAALFNRLEMQSRVDGLTGVLRRQPFMDRLADELKRASAFRTAFSVLMVDIDHFKAVNDGHGHAAGDAVLARVGAILKSSFYETDVVGRYGGEEFIVLLPRAESDGVLRKAEALRRRFESESIESGFERLKITVSIGVARFPEAGTTADDLIAAADRALYRAKESGRNRVIAADAA